MDNFYTYHYFVSPPTSWGNAHSRSAPRTASGTCLTIFPNTSAMIIPHVNMYDASLNMCNTQHLQPLITMHHGHAHHHHWRNTSVRCTHILSRNAPLSSCTTRGWFMFILLGQYSYFRAERGKMHIMYVHQCIALQWCIILSTNKLEELIGEKESIRNNSIWGSCYTLVIVVGWKVYNCFSLKMYACPTIFSIQHYQTKIKSDEAQIQVSGLPSRRWGEGWVSLRGLDSTFTTLWRWWRWGWWSFWWWICWWRWWCR